MPRKFSLKGYESTSLWVQNVPVREELFSGGQANFLPLLSAPSENGLFLDSNGQAGKGRHIYNTETGPRDYTYDGGGDERGHLGGAVIWGDSFFNAMHRTRLTQPGSGQELANGGLPAGQ
jgi:hypothetical protein